ncbi:hypothetical protein [Geomesophilobacter sediminis]|uniref:Uncharacterized protein n=1 Tax=Geomesophilobacter sediminis TaxID=2798584 RepID=A0A8J7M125_9BACT|nr:hypothetical protein [Geomesophilobacter sediminis]MBJ6726695.1 hypothetical protein [Geomesophilobacter sediminis]
MGNQTSARTEKQEPPLQAEYRRLRTALKETQEELDRNRAELARLKHRWIVQKGRLPTAKEIKEYEEKLAQGKKVKPEENPYVNRNPLSSPARARAAFYGKLEEVRREESHLKQLNDDLAALERKAARAGAPAP